MNELLELISEFPHLHEEYAPRLRRAVLPRWSLGVFYRSTSRFILIAAVVDLRRDPAAIRRRLGLHEGGELFAPRLSMAVPNGITFGPDNKVRLPARFNVAVPFIDRHVGEGRGAKAAIRTVHGETVTYAELAE